MPMLVADLQRLKIEFEDPVIRIRLKRVTIKSNGTHALKIFPTMAPYLRMIFLNPWLKLSGKNSLRLRITSKNQVKLS